MLGLLLQKTQEHFYSINQVYLAYLYRALFATAYFRLFRVGELTSGEHPVQVRDVQLGDNKQKVMFILRTSKTHGKGAKPHLIKISSNKVSKQMVSSSPHKSHHNSTSERIEPFPFCPYNLLRQYFQVRPRYMERTEAFFIFRDQQPVSPSHFRKTLRMVIELCGFNLLLYNTHSLRIGRAVDMLRLHVPIAAIKIFGRWQSNAVYNYLKMC